MKIDDLAIQNIYYIVGIIVAIPTLVSVIINIMTYCFNKRSLKIKEAINLTKFFKEKILNYAYAIKSVYTGSKICSLYEKIKISQTSDFDLREIQRYGVDKDKIEKSFNSKEFYEAILIANIQYNLNMPIEIVKKTKNDKGIQVTFDMSSTTKYFMEKIVYDTLNNLEYFAMAFRHGVANEKVAYNSLHQCFVPTVESLYYQISNNNDLSNKYFTNIIWLYKKWKKREVEREKEIDKLNCSSNHFEPKV